VAAVESSAGQTAVGTSRLMSHHGWSATTLFKRVKHWRTNASVKSHTGFRNLERVDGRSVGPAREASGLAVRPEERMVRNRERSEVVMGHTRIEPALLVSNHP
jgi:hypothetical protein